MSAPAPRTRPTHRMSGWLPLLDAPQRSLTPLEFALLRLELHGRAATLARALHLPDGAGYAERLLGQAQGRPALHAGNLATLTAPLPPAFARAFAAALGGAVPDDWGREPAAGPRLSLLRLPVLLRQAGASQTGRNRKGDDLASQLTQAVHRLAQHPAAVSPMTAALTLTVLHGLTRQWLDDQAALHLELLGGAGNQPETAESHAWQHVATTLSGMRRLLARLVVRETRRQHRLLARYQQAQDDARRELVRACVRAARKLTRSGHLTRVGQGRWLTPEELRDALDGTLNPLSLRELVKVRQAHHQAERQVALRELQPARMRGTLLPGQSLSPGVRDGRLHRYQAGVPVPQGAIMLTDDWSPAALPSLADTGALLVLDGSVQGRAAQFARRRGLCALSIPSLPDWAEEGALVRVNGHRGTLTLLRRAQDMPRPGAPEPFDLDLAATAGLPHVRVVPRQMASISLDF